jgi:hypothetical protein
MAKGCRSESKYILIYSCKVVWPCRNLDFNGKISRNTNYLRKHINPCAPVFFNRLFYQLREFFVNNNIHGFYYLMPDLAVLRP